MKQIVRVFPDFCSSGLWSEKPSVNYWSEDFLDVLSPIDLLALKYWHLSWEMSMDFENGCKNNLSWQAQFEKDGQTIVDAWNAKQDIYEFIYVGDCF